MDKDNDDMAEIIPHDELVKDGQYCRVPDLATNCEHDHHDRHHYDDQSDDVNDDYDEVNKDATNNSADDDAETQVPPSEGSGPNQSLDCKPAAGAIAVATANSNARIMRLRGSYFQDRDIQDLNYNSSAANMNIPRLDEFSDDSFEYPETSGDHGTYDDEEGEFTDDVRDNGSTPSSPSELIVSTKNSTRWIDEDYPAIAWITPSGDSVVEMLLRRSQRMALLLLLGTMCIAVMSIYTLRYRFTTSQVRFTSSFPVASELKQMVMVPTDVSTPSPKQCQGRNTTPQIVLNQVDQRSKTSNVRHPSESQSLFPSVPLSLYTVHDKAKTKQISKPMSVALVQFTPSAHNAKEEHQLDSPEIMYSPSVWGMLPTMMARSSLSSRDYSGLLDPWSTVRRVRQLEALTKTVPSLSSLSLPCEISTLTQEKQRKKPSLLRRLFSLLGNHHSTTKPHLGMETISISRSTLGTIPLSVAQLSSLQLSSLQMHGAVPPSSDATRSTTTANLVLLNLLAARIIVAQERLAKWQLSKRESTTANAHSRIEIGNPVLWGTIPSNLGQSSLLVGLLEHHFTAVESFVQDSRRMRRRRRLDDATTGEEASSLHTRSSKLGNKHAWQDLALIQGWMAPASGLAGTISKIGPSAIQIGMNLQKLSV